MYEDLEEEYNEEQNEHKVRKATKQGFTYSKFKKSLGDFAEELEETDIYFLYEQECIQKFS